MKTVTIKTIVRNQLHETEKSYDFTLKDYNGKKAKYTYEAYNAVERHTTEIFDGAKMESGAFNARPWMAAKYFSLCNMDAKTKNGTSGQIDVNC